MKRALFFAVYAVSFFLTIESIISYVSDYLGPTRREETITTVTYGEYYPVTPLGRVIAGVTMFAAIGFLWTFVGLVGSLLVTRKFREANKQQQPSSRSTVANETKQLIKNKIDILSIEILEEKDLEDLIMLVRTINSEKDLQ